MVIPKIKACIEDNCATLLITDIVLPYDPDTNTGGWGTPNIDPSDADNIYITVTAPSGLSTVYTIDATDITQPVVDEFELLSTDASGDGQYTVKYTVVVAGVNQVYSTCFFNLCSVRCCIDKLWVKAAMEKSIGDCGCTGEKADYSKKAMEAESIYRAILSCIACNKPTTRDLLLKKLQRICNLEKCNCS